MKNYKIAVAGTGYVGLSLGVLLSQHHQVVAVDIVQAKVDMINNKKSPIQDSVKVLFIRIWSIWAEQTPRRCSGPRTLRTMCSVKIDFPI